MKNKTKSQLVSEAIAAIFSEQNVNLAEGVEYLADIAALGLHIYLRDKETPALLRPVLRQRLAKDMVETFTERFARASDLASQGHCVVCERCQSELEKHSPSGRKTLFAKGHGAAYEQPEGEETRKDAGLPPEIEELVEVMRSKFAAAGIDADVTVLGAPKGPITDLLDALLRAQGTMSPEEMLASAVAAREGRKH